MKFPFMLFVMLVCLFGVGEVRADEISRNDETQMKEENVVKFCLICGPGEKMFGEEKFKHEYKGKTYYFCSEFCLDEFKLNPEKYIKRASDLEHHDEHEGHDHAHDEHKDHNHQK